MYNNYLSMLMAPILVFGLTCATVGVSLEPLVGDLTRLGGYAENDYGWNGVEQVYNPPLAQPGSLTESAEIVVVGDSFSSHTSPDRQTPVGGYWVDHLAAQTGLSLQVFNMDKVPLQQYLQSRAYREHPPRFLVYESVERELRGRLAEQPCDAGSIPAEPSPARPAPAWQQINRQPERIDRQSPTYHNSGFFGRAIDYLRKNIGKQMLKSDGGVVRQFELLRDDLFSSVRSADLLTFAGDSHTQDWSEHDWDTMRCTLRRLQHEVEANGRTELLIVIAPDKSSAYGHLLRQPLRGQQPLAHLGQAGLHLVPVETALKAAIDAGTDDVYLPDDTHWGSTGSLIAAKTVADYMRRHP